MANSGTRYLDDGEIAAFLDDLDHDGDGLISYAEVEAKLDQVHDEIAPNRSAPHHFDFLPRAFSSRDATATTSRHAFLRAVVGGAHEKRIPRDEFASRVREWRIPSMKQDAEEEQTQKEYLRSLGTWRRVRSYWAVHGPEILFLVLVVGSQIAFGVWQLVKYVTETRYRDAFGWGVVLAKTCAGALYPTMFFLLLSMSRYFSTFMRRWYYVSRFINWDRSQAFHIRMSIVAIVLATLHAIGHLSGSFVWGSRPENENAVANVLGQHMVPRPYGDYVASLPGFTGLTALGLFYLLSLLSLPQVRRWNYELFQLGHLLMYPIIGLLMAHGTSGLLQWPMLGYFLAFPTLLIVLERTMRFIMGFHHLPASIEILDSETVEIKTTIPKNRPWKYQAGQYVFLQVPKLGFFQWHPFTVSACVGREMWIHVKTDGNWTSKLRALARNSGKTTIDIGVDGPFGAPAQRFYDFSHTVVVGAGIGVTPFSGILADLQENDNELHGGPRKLMASTESSPVEQVFHDTKIGDGAEGQPSRSHSPSESSLPPKKRNTYPRDYRRVDFHWIVRDRNHLLWFSDLLNDVARSQLWHRSHDLGSHLDILIQTHVTQKRKKITTHVYRWLLEQHRTKDHPESPLTGLINPTHFGRPDFVKILDAHYEEVKEYRAARLAGETCESMRDRMAGKDFKVGVFFCGTPLVGEILADRCRALSARGRSDGTKIEYHFMMEVFG
ncbi:FAD-binding domain-containing protein [Xylariomycetidae sp. FL2044]|nr:FAD-binding domain-containing protein [Xylariomycetidae sp. FL2044]